MATIGGEGNFCAGCGHKFVVSDIFIELAVAVDDAEGVPHLVEDGGEEVVFTIGLAVGVGGKIVSSRSSTEFAVILWCAVDEPADSVAVIVEGDGGGVGAVEGVVSVDGGFC
jgi:hypothetical protein